MYIFGFFFSPSVSLCICLFVYKSKYKKVGVLPIWKVKSNVSSVGPSSERNMILPDVRLYYPYRQHTTAYAATYTFISLFVCCCFLWNKFLCVWQFLCSFFGSICLYHHLSFSHFCLFRTTFPESRHVQFNKQTLNKVIGTRGSSADVNIYNLQTFVKRIRLAN